MLDQCLFRERDGPEQFLFVCCIPFELKTKKNVHILVIIDTKWQIKTSVKKGKKIPNAATILRDPVYICLHFGTITKSVCDGSDLRTHLQCTISLLNNLINQLMPFGSLHCCLIWTVLSLIRDHQIRSQVDPLLHGKTCQLAPALAYDNLIS